MPLTKVTSGAITDSAITTAKIEDGTIVNADINASANIAQSKLSLSLPTISSITIQDSQGAIPPSDTSLYFDIIGTNFTNPSTVELLDSSTNVSTNATTVTYVSATQLRVTASLSAGTYKIKVTRNDGFAGISATALLTVSQAVSWSTSAGSLGTFDESLAISTITLSATSNSSVTYAVQSGSLPTGLSLNTSNGEITGTPSAVSADTTSTFTVRATDAESQYADREFTITVTNIVIQQSLRSNVADGNYLYKTFSTPTNAKKFTLSFWTKRSDLSAVQYLLVAGTGAPYTTVGFAADDTFGIGLNAGSGAVGLYTTQVFRDPSAWYHAFIVMDTTQATDSNRLKMYINGSQITSFSNESYPAQDSTWTINSAVQHDVVGSSAVQDYGGYTAEYHFLDGYTAAVTDFGQTGSNGRWIPKTYAGGNYGTNGFYLDFADSSAFGDDESGNTNDFTNSGYAATDQVKDTPQNNFATLNALHRYTDRFSEGNLKLNGVEKTGTPVELQTSTLGATSGKWYWEVKFEWTGSLTSTDTRMGIGTELSVPPNPNSLSNDANVVMVGGNKGNTISFRNLNSSPTTNTTGFNTLDPDDIFMFALDIDNKKLFIGKNGSWYNSADPVAGTNAQAYSWTFSNGDITFPVISFYSGDTASNTYNHTLLPNFGNPAFSITSGNTDENGYGNFEYAPPSGYKALCTNNLPEPTIKDSSEYFNTALYTGNGSSQSITGVGFQPDFIWVKERSSTSSHQLTNSSVGVGKRLSSDLNSVEYSDATMVTSFDSDGFSVGSHGGHNENTQTYVAWQWKANGGTTTSNTDGDITSTVQVNSTTGFSIVTYSGNGSANLAVGHGLGSTPDLVIQKCRSGFAGQSWNVWGNNLGFTRLALDNTNADAGNYGISFSSTTITLPNVNDNAWSNTGGEYILYVFKSIPGYSKFDSYTGNGSTDGAFIYTGFKPAWVMIKRYDSATGAAWYMFDNKRNTFNVVKNRLVAQDVDTEATNFDALDFTSNGFKFRNADVGWNTSGGTYFYMAFAESPFGGILTNEATAR